MTFGHLIVFDPLNWRRAAYVGSLVALAEDGITLSEASTPKDVRNTNAKALCLFIAGANQIHSGAVKNSLDEIVTHFDGRVAVISDYIRPEDIAHALKHELAGILSSGDPLEVSLAALRFLLAGGRYIPHAHSTSQDPTSFDVSYLPRRIASIDASDEKISDAHLQEDLTVRQTEVLFKLAEGASNKQIARNLSLSEATVKSHVREIMRKLDVSNRTQAALQVRQLQLRTAMQK